MQRSPKASKYGSKKKNVVSKPLDHGDGIDVDDSDEHEIDNYIDAVQEGRGMEVYDPESAAVYKVGGDKPKRPQSAKQARANLREKKRRKE